MAQLTYSGTWSKEGLTTSPIKIPRQRAGMSPRARSRSVHSPQRGPANPRRFASGQQPMRPVRLFDYDPDYSLDGPNGPDGPDGPDGPNGANGGDWDDWESEDSIYFENSPMRRRERSPERAPERRMKSQQMTWLRLALNLGVMICAVAFTLKALFTIQADLVIKFAQARADLVAEIDSCRRSYASNHCPNDAPLLVHACHEWEKCMNLDPDKAGQVRATAGALGEIIEAFVGRLDLRSMVVLMAVGIVVVYWR